MTIWPDHYNMFRQVLDEHNTHRERGKRTVTYIGANIVRLYIHEGPNNKQTKEKQGA